MRKKKEIEKKGRGRKRRKIAPQNQKESEVDSGKVHSYLLVQLKEIKSVDVDAGFGGKDPKMKASYQSKA